jgi:hypothetical protein
MSYGIPTGLNSGAGLGGSVVGRLYGGAAAPPMAGIPEGGTIREAAYGEVPGVNIPGGQPGIRATVVSGICLVLIVAIWWGLPRGR